jgi:membrane-bound metal-dependent hydrolase YbcI (DUF457 family)
MFVGHYAVSYAAKAVEPRAPMWTLVAAAQLVDIGWSVLIATGVERGHIDTSLEGSSLVLTDMPWTHSLPAALAWSAGAGLLSRFALRLPARAAWLIAAVVFSHWLLDLLVHRPDLALWPGGPKLGLALWDYAVPEQAIEIGLLAIAGMFWTAARIRRGDPAWPAALFTAFLVAAQIGVMFFPAVDGPIPVGTGIGALVLYLIITAAAIPLDGPRDPSPQP